MNVLTVCLSINNNPKENIMKKIILYFALGLATLLSCSKEDDLKPSGARDDYFTISPDAKDEESVLRRTFYETNKIHLLFNDTLRHEQRGTYADGTPYWFTETLDLGYGIDSYDQTERTFTFLKDMDAKKAAVQLVENYVLNHLGESLLPYSCFLVETIEEYVFDDDLYDYIWKPNSTIQGLRCLALATGDVRGMSETEMQRQAAKLCCAVVNSIFNELANNYDDKTFDEFYSFSSTNYGRYFYSEPSEKEMYEKGFLTYEYDDYYGDYSWPYKKDDRSSFLQAIFYQDETEFKEKFADYPVILQKYDVLKKIVMDQGYKF